METTGRCPTPEETVLRGGVSNDGLVVRVGDTVRRPRGPGTAAVHALLRHLEDVGFDGAPRVLGEDEQGREVLEYLPGEVPFAPHPPWARTDEALASVGALLRRYHEAVRGFDPAGHDWACAVPAAFAGTVACHNDVNLDNVVFRDGVAVALIDFDLASPADPVWDLGLAARLWVPLRDPADVGDDRAGRVRERLLLLADAYGCTRAQRARLMAAAAASHGWCYDIVREGARRGQPGYVRYWTPSAHEHDERGRRWLRDSEAALSEAVRDA